MTAKEFVVHKPTTFEDLFCAALIQGRHGSGPSFGTTRYPGLSTWGDPPMHTTNRVHVRVDSGRCQGHNRCQALAPELFELNETGTPRRVET